MSGSCALSCFQALTCCFDLFPSRACMSWQNLKFDGQVVGKLSALHWREACVSWHPKLMTLWMLIIFMATVPVAIRQYMVANEPYIGQYAVVEFTTVGAVTIAGWTVCKAFVQLKYGPKDDSPTTEQEWTQDTSPLPGIVRAQWFFHTLAVPVNWVAVFIYAIHIGFGNRHADITFIRSIVQMILVTVDMFIGREPFLEMHIVYVFGTCLLYGIIVAAVFGNRFPLADTFSGVALSIPTYGAVYVLENILQLVIKREVFYKSATTVYPENVDDERGEDVGVGLTAHKRGPPVQ